MSDILIRPADDCAGEIVGQWDTVWVAEGGYGTWALAGPSETRNVGGLQATSAIETAVLICLFTDRRCPANHPLAKFAGADPRGYWGDSVDVRTDLGEAEMGSLWWLVMARGIADLDAARWIEAMGAEALAPLVNQRACARIDVSATAYPEQGLVTCDIALYGRDGTQVYARRFDVLWRQLGL